MKSRSRNIAFILIGAILGLAIVYFLPTGNDQGNIDLRSKKWIIVDEINSGNLKATTIDSRGGWKSVVFEHDRVKIKVINDCGSWYYLGWVDGKDVNIDKGMRLPANRIPYEYYDRLNYMFKKAMNHE